MRKAAHNRRLAKVAVQSSADIPQYCGMVNQSLVHRICPDGYPDGETRPNAKPQNVSGNFLQPSIEKQSNKCKIQKNDKKNDKISISNMFITDCMPNQSQYGQSR